MIGFTSDASGLPVVLPGVAVVPCTTWDSFFTTSRAGTAPVVGVVVGRCAPSILCAAAPERARASLDRREILAAWRCASMQHCRKRRLPTVRLVIGNWPLGRQGAVERWPSRGGAVGCDTGIVIGCVMGSAGRVGIGRTAFVDPVMTPVVPVSLTGGRDAGTREGPDLGRDGAVEGEAIKEEFGLTAFALLGSGTGSGAGDVGLTGQATGLVSCHSIFPTGLSGVDVAEAASSTFIAGGLVDVGGVIVGAESVRAGWDFVSMTRYRVYEIFFACRGISKAVVG